MINYYKFLNVENTATNNVIKVAIAQSRAEIVSNGPNPEVDDMINEAESILLDDTKRAKYDKKLSRSEFLRKNGVRITAIGTISALGITALVLGTKGCNNKKIIGGNEPAPTVTPVIKPTAKPTTKPVEVPTSTPTEETPIIVEKLDASNIDTIADKMLADYESKGLKTIGKDLMKSALVMTNITSFSKEDIAAMYEGEHISIVTLIDNMDKYTSLVATHNNKLTDNMLNYVCMYNLSYNANDRATLKELDQYNMWLIDSVNGSRDKKETYQDAFNYFKDFYTCNDEKALYNNMTTGGQYVAEAYYMVSAEQIVRTNSLNKQQLEDMKYLSTDVVDGHRFMPAVYVYGEMICPAEKQLTK